MNDENRTNPLSTADMVTAVNKQEETSEMKKVILEEQNESSQKEEFGSLFERDKVDDFRSRWLDIQTRFVDNPKDSVQDADMLVAEVIKNIAKIFAEERSYLEEQWKQGDEVSTEDLRVSLMRYRSFFTRLLMMGK